VKVPGRGKEGKKHVQAGGLESSSISESAQSAGGGGHAIDEQLRREKGVPDSRLGEAREGKRATETRPKKRRMIMFAP
jgi:hypothetical protein